VSGARANGFETERGIALVLALMAMVLLAALGGALAVLTATETTIAARFRDGLEAFYAAEAGIARAAVDLRAADWDAARAGTAQSTFRGDGVDLRAAAQDIDAVEGTRSWQPYAYGRLRDLVPGGQADSGLSIVVWVAADSSSASSSSSSSSSAEDDEVIVVRSHAYGARGVRRMVEATLRKSVDGPRVIAWREGM
jgi:hypothetical protein